MLSYSITLIKIVKYQSFFLKKGALENLWDLNLYEYNLFKKDFVLKVKLDGQGLLKWWSENIIQ